MAFTNNFRVTPTGVSVGTAATGTTSIPTFKVAVPAVFDETVKINGELDIGTGWQSLSLASNISAGSTSYGACGAGPGLWYRVDGNHVTVTGSLAFTPAYQQNLSATGAVPTAYRPPYGISGIMVMNENRIGNIHLTTAGTLNMVCIYYSGSSKATTDAVTWTDFRLEYWINE